MKFVHMLFYFLERNKYFQRKMEREQASENSKITFIVTEK